MPGLLGLTGLPLAAKQLKVAIGTPICWPSAEQSPGTGADPTLETVQLKVHVPTAGVAPVVVTTSHTVEFPAGGDW